MLKIRTEVTHKLLVSALGVQFHNSIAIRTYHAVLYRTSFRAAAFALTNDKLGYIAHVRTRVENSFYKMSSLHDLCSEIASSEGMAILNRVELECMIYSKLSDRYKGFFSMHGIEIHLALFAAKIAWAQNLL